MRTYRREFRIRRLRALRRILSRRGLVLTVRIETDAAAVVATIDDRPHVRPKPRWHAPDEAWRP